MTAEELQETLDKAVLGFRSIPGVSDDLADMLVGEGFVSYDDLSIIEPDALQEMGGLSEEEADAIIDEADRRANSNEPVVLPTDSESAGVDAESDDSVSEN